MLAESNFYAIVNITYIVTKFMSSNICGLRFKIMSSLLDQGTGRTGTLVLDW